MHAAEQTAALVAQFASEVAEAAHVASTCIKLLLAHLILYR